MGIFEIVCPGCGEVNSVDAGSCACGHIFNAVTGSYEAAQLQLQEEEAYFEYIKARLKQLKKDKEFAKSAVTATPGNKERQDDLEKIRNEIAELKAQYEFQQAQIKATQKVNAELKGQMEREAAEARARAEAEAARLKREKEKAEALRKAKEKAELERQQQKLEAEKKAKQEAIQKQKAAETEKQRIAAEKQKAEAAKLKAEAEKKAHAEALRKQKQAAEENKRKEIERKMQAARKLTAEKSAKAARSIPRPNAFRKAAAIARGHTPAPMPDPIQALSEAASAIEQPEALICPICTAELPLTATRCGCGYEFRQSASDMPALSTGDFFAPVQADGNQETQQCPVCTAEVAASARACNCGYEFPSGESSMPGLSLDGSLD
jgi:hypothetical protein